MQRNVKRRPYWEYVAVLDSRTRPEHRALNGTVLPADDPFWKTHKPPLGFRCRCTVVNHTKESLAREGLTVSSSEGRMVNKEIPLPGAGVRANHDSAPLTTTVTGYKTDSGRVVYTDPGWNYDKG